MSLPSIPPGAPGLRVKKSSSGLITGSATPNGKALDSPVKSSFLARPVGGPMASGAGPVTGNFLTGISSPVAFSAYRIHYHHLGGAGPLIGFKSISAATDDVGTRDFTTLTDANFKKTVSPKRSGTTYNNLVSDGSPGWKFNNWAGKPTLDLPDLGGTQATGNVIFTSNPANGTTLTLNGTAITFVTSGATGNQVNIGGSLTTTLASLLTLLQGSADAQLVKFTYLVTGSTLFLTAVAVAVAGNALTVATTVAGTTISSATLIGGYGYIATGQSDMIYDPGVLDTVNGFYPLLFRYIWGDGSISFVNNLNGQQTGTNVKTDFPTLFFMNLSRSGSDAVTTPSNWGDQNTPSSTASGPIITVEFFNAQGISIKVLTIAMVGDSRAGVSAETSALFEYRSSENYLKTAFDTLGIPVSILRHGQSGISSAQFMDFSMPDFILETAPDWVVYLMYSRNPSSTFIETDANIATVKAQTLKIIQAARKVGTRVLLVPSFPTGLSGTPLYTAPQLANLQALTTWAQNVGDIVYDGLTRWGNSDGSWKAGVAFDAPHMLNATEITYTQELAALIASY
jgi:hypothetical protein